MTSLLAAIDADGVGSGLGWELVTGVGVATWVAHLYAEVVGDRALQVLRRAEPERARIADVELQDLEAFLFEPLRLRQDWTAYVIADICELL